MQTKMTTLSAALGLVLLAGHLPVASASIAGVDFSEVDVSGPEALAAEDVRPTWGNLRYCDPQAQVSDYLPGGAQAMAAGDKEPVFEKVSFLSGAGFFTDRFDIMTAGSYQVTLTDFAFPNALTESGLNITSATESFGSLTGPGSFTFDADPGHYFLGFYGKAPDLGQYGIEISRAGAMVTGTGQVSAVPVPAAAWLFGSGLLGLAGWIRRRPS